MNPGSGNCSIKSTPVFELFEEEELGLVQVEQKDPGREKGGRLCPIMADF
jgi:hypothetical protein